MKMKKKKTIHKPAAHFTAGYILNPAHPVTINVVGCGGTGSQVINSLARMHSALRALGHPGLYVRAIDPKKVTEANMGRQLFSPADIGISKPVVLIGRINRFFGTDWAGEPIYYSDKAGIPPANVTISCVDSGKARRQIKSALDNAVKLSPETTYGRYRYPGDLQPYEVPYYWMDFGNMRDRGQVIIGTLTKIPQQESDDFQPISVLPSIDKLHPDIMVDNIDDDQGPSCSLAEALKSQDLFINTNLANMGMALLWKMFRQAHITCHGLYLNLDTMQVNPIRIDK